MRRLSLLVVAATTLIASCSSTEPSRGGAQYELLVNRERWRAANLGDYSMEYLRSCFCAEEGLGLVRVTVHRDTVTAVTRLTNLDWPAPSPPESWPTVDKLFDIVQQAIDRDSELEVEYDRTLGYPQSIVIDRQAMANDGGWSASVSNVRSASSP